ncbi:MAG TPA: TerB family tellurite resistance protein [Caldithrix abyssi]|uniref:TerB family tellurite resistance protein n=1 Tax=Caldithrix abyssi TaxID=187145 RepID=A0A7V5H5D7_CALAY|nr:TerB family tellurite resistance protein [Caldisericaceae bacterium]HHE55877.1 TerB family tellurite resistance protein [Caldithrix abyssi]
MFKFLEKILNEEADRKQVDERDLMVATAGLFLEMVYADFEIHPDEEKQLTDALSNLFDLTQEEINQLLNKAKQNRDQRQDIWQFASLLKDHLERDQRLQILTNLWRIVFADGRVDKYEDALMRKITNLLGLDHSEMIETKLRVKNEVG